MKALIKDLRHEGLASVCRGPRLISSFALELKAVYDRLTLDRVQDLAALIPSSFAASWRHRALEGLLPVFTAAEDLPADCPIIPFRACSAQSSG